MMHNLSSATGQTKAFPALKSGGPRNNQVPVQIQKAEAFNVKVTTNAYVYVNVKGQIQSNF